MNVLLLLVCLSPLCWAGTASRSTLFTAEQETWLAAHSTLRVGVVLQPPFAQSDRRQQGLSGASIELMDHLARQLRVQLVWTSFQNQAALEEALNARAIDLAPGLTQTPAGLRVALFSDPYLRIPHLLVGVRSATGSVDLEQVDGTVPIAVAGSEAVLGYLRSSFAQLNVQAVESPREAMRRVQEQRAGYAVVDQAQLSRLSREAEFADMAIVGDIGLPQLLRVASRSDWPVLASVVDIGLRAIAPRDLEQLHERWLQPGYAAPPVSVGFWKSLCVFLALLFLACLALLLTVRRQRDTLEFRLLAARHEIELRETAKDALRLAQFSIDHSTVGILWVNWDSHVRYANRAAERMLGYLPGTVVDRPLRDFEPRLDMDRWLNLWRHARQGDDGPLSFETECQRADGRLLPV
ncbi:MAG TPA: transporter substrate-binding domain-containing protein, partial [Pseudomonas sp.]|nr:transporter substrate-binding domain-containing protein [Pseudomonas sp.]